MVPGYLIEMSEREHEACRRLVQLPFLSERLFGAFRLQAEFSWFLLQLKKERLVPSLSGDIDILAGPLSWNDAEIFRALVCEERTGDHIGRHDSWNYKLAALRLAGAGGIKWPPSMVRLIAVEAKCAYLDPCARCISIKSLRSTKTSRTKVDKVRRQVQSLLNMGFNHAALLDIIANPPVTGPDGGAWVSALTVASESATAMSTVLKERLPQESEAAHWVWSSGAVMGGDEFHRGAGCPVELRASRGNSQLVTSVSTQSARQEVEKRLLALLSEFPIPVGFPAVFVDCTACGKLHTVSWDGAPCRTAV